ncbi:response regulator transcription factor [Streptomyces sp. AD681]|uniref:response regulator transcription factor n=1 Tax=Streptomyces sp. AD681 TaxID=3019069 RepID=UPI0022F1A7A3|nr:response regulator transcription factor [Streptomyces sp. AD681]MDA5146631.1 response regulator transcription factor [Streptomyces sp. AD681]
MNRQSTEVLEPRTARRHGSLHQTPSISGSSLAEALAPPRQGALRLLVVENEARAADLLVQGLRRHGYAAESVSTGAEALRTYQGSDLVLLDVDLPDLDGLEVCRSLRATSEMPIIAVTARDSELDRVLGLQAGADDYMSKPYGFRELLARIEAVMRRVRPKQPAEQVLTHGPLRIDARLREIWLDGRSVGVTRKEFDLLYLLAAQPGKVVSRRQLMTQVWEDSWSRPGRTIDTHVSSLRSKLGSSTWIITVRGVGFRLGHP